MHARLYLVVLLAIVSLTASAHSVTEEDDCYVIEHSWRFEEEQCSFLLRINKELYDYYQKDREHLIYKYKMDDKVVPPSYFSFMFSEHDRPVVREMARQFDEAALSELESIKLAVSFVQSLPYAFDSESKGVDEYVRYPVETLVDGCGDCEDKVALLAAILYEMKADFILLRLPEHMAIGLHSVGVVADSYLLFQDKKYYYIETTNNGWQIGQIPEKYSSAEMEAIPIDATPNMLVKGVRFESQPAIVLEKASCEFEIDLHNLGPCKVTNLQLYVRLYNRGRKNRLLAEEHYAISDLQEGEMRTETLSFKSFIREDCVLQVEIVGDNIDTQSFEYNLDYTRTRRF